MAAGRQQRQEQRQQQQPPAPPYVQPPSLGFSHRPGSPLAPPSPSPPPSVLAQAAWGPGGGGGGGGRAAAAGAEEEQQPPLGPSAFVAERYGPSGVPVSFRGEVRRLSSHVLTLPNFEGGATLMLRPLSFSLTTKEGTAVSAAVVAPDLPLRGHGLLFGTAHERPVRVTASSSSLAGGAGAAGRVVVLVEAEEEADPRRPAEEGRRRFSPAYRFDLPWPERRGRGGGGGAARVPESVFRDAATWGMFRAMAADRPPLPPPAPRPPAKVHTTDLGFSGRLGAILVAAVMFLVLAGAAALSPPESIFGTIG